MAELFLARYAYVLVLVLLAVGLYGMLGMRNFAKKLIGLVIFQSGIFLFFIEGAAKDGGTVPIIDPELGSDAALYVNPLPHLLILTAIVVGAAVAGVGIALLMRIQRAYGSLDEDEVLRQLSD
jgi:multicomponent Na+:H+ antiporter subunit C